MLAYHLWTWAVNGGPVWPGQAGLPWLARMLDLVGTYELPCWAVMAETAAAQSDSLASGLVNRLNQLGMSRRELARRTGLSRQTIHNIEHEGMTNLKPSTFDLLDQALKWAPGTALALALGKGTPATIEERLTTYLVRIAVHLSHMTAEQLELTLIMMEEHELGKSVHTTDEFTRKVGKLVQKLLSEVAHLTGESIAKNAS